MKLEQQPKVSLGFLPTPLQELTRLGKILNTPRIFIKRDDQTGLAFGGNKTRKLEYLLGDALNHGDIDTLITTGAVQSNHCRQTAAAAAKMGLRCELLLGGSQPNDLDGNTLLDYLLGANLHWTESNDSQLMLKDLAEKVRASGYKPYIIPYGASNPIGALGYVNAMIELIQQLQTLPSPIDYIIFASCSGGTQVGLQIGADFMNFKGQIIGISIDSDVSQKNKYQELLTNLANETCDLLQLPQTYHNQNFTVNYDYAKGYGVVGDLERNAILQLAQLEGILLDPVYTGRAFGGLLDLINKNFFKKEDSILFWHTGGSSALFPYREKLINEKLKGHPS